MRAKDVRLIAIEEVRNYGQILYIKNIVENGWWENAYPSSYPLDPPLAISCKNHPNSLAYFSHLAPLILLFFTKRQSQKGGGHGTMARPLNTLLHRPYQLSSYSQFYRDISENNKYCTKIA